MSYDQFLLRLLEGEWQRRTENAVARRLKEAKFPIRKYLADFDRTKYDAAFLPKFEELETLEFIDNKLFNLMSIRNDKGSIIITTNLNFDRWEEVFVDPTLTGAMIDRFAHKAHILGNGSRMAITLCRFVGDFCRPISRERGGRFEETIYG